MVEGQRRGWNEGLGAVTRSFDEWRMTDSDIRTFLALTTRWMDERYQQVWNELGEQPGWDDGPELTDLFYDAVDGLEPLDYHWMLQAAVVRDAVSAFEVYLERSPTCAANCARRSSANSSARTVTAVSRATVLSSPSRR